MREGLHPEQIELVDAMRARHDDIVDESTQRLSRAHLPHYEATGLGESRGRLDDLLPMVTDAVAERSLVNICHYADTVASERFEAGFDLSEVQSAFNVLEETLWHLLTSKTDAEIVTEAAGLIDTVLGAAKDTIARTWISLASRRHVRSLDLSALFKGAGS
jgi:hypothetical protein